MGKQDFKKEEVGVVAISPAEEAAKPLGLPTQAVQYQNLAGEIKEVVVPIAIATSTRQSKSSKFVSIRHLVETLLLGRPAITFKEMEEIVKVEYPISKFDKSHFNWYKNQIFKHKRVKNRLAI